MKFSVSTLEGEKFMRIGVSICSNYRVSDPRLGAQFMVERARAARAANLDTLFVGDHHNVPVPYYQSDPQSDPTRPLNHSAMRPGAS